jgi:outer membrane protein TolC
LLLALLANGAVLGQENELPPPRPAEAPPRPTETPPPGRPPLHLADAVRQSLANVDVVQANVALQTATVARFEALKEFVPLINLPQLAVAFRQLSGPSTNATLLFPDVTLGALLVGQPSLQPATANRVNLFFPLAPSGHITALPIAEEGIRAKVLMEQLVRRSQVMLAIQDYYVAKRLQYALRTARLGVELAQQILALNQRKLLQKQAYVVEVNEAAVNAGRASVLLADLEKDSRIAQRDLAVVLHQSRLLVPQQQDHPIPIELGHHYNFDLDDPDEVDLRWMPDFPGCREEAIQLAKQQRVEVRLRIVGLRIARLRRQRSVLGLLGAGSLPVELSFKNATSFDGYTTLGAIFGSSYGVPVLDIGLWSNIRAARLDVVASQLELEKALLEVASDAGNSWDRWQQAIRDWEQREAELRLRRELLERQQRLYEQKQSIAVEVLGAQVNLLQADANRWTAWYNLQLARFDVLRATEQLLDYVERARIAKLTTWQKPPPEGLWHRWLPWLASKQSSGKK